MQSVMARRHAGMVFPVWIILSYVMSMAGSQKTCTDIAMFSNQTQQWKYLSGSEFYSLQDMSLLGCVKECQLRKRCVSLNFGARSGGCVLNEGSSTDTSLNFTNSPNSVYSEVHEWNGVIAGACASHTCPENTQCRENKTGNYDCIPESCMDPPKVSNAQINFTSRFMEIGADVPYVCDEPFVPAGRRTCLPNGTWGGDFRCVRIRSCADIKNCKSSYGNGEYWIYVFQEKFSLLKVYCHNMWSSPVSFLTLKGDTYSDVPNQNSSEACGSWWSDQYCGKTVFNKVKFETWNMLISRYHYGFITEECLRAPLGWTADCRHCSAAPEQGSFRIDTTGTGVKLSKDIYWVSNNGTLSSDPVVNRSADGNVITGECIGGCDYCTPTGSGTFGYGFYVDLDPTFQPDLSQAEFPQCTV